MSRGPSSRRLFLKQSAFSVGGVVLLNLVPGVLQAARREADAAAAAGESFAFFSPEEAADVKAFAAQIFPTDDTPGADEANVVYFIDRVLDKYEPGNRDMFRRCIAHVNQDAARLYPGSTRFSALSIAQQTEVLNKFGTFVRKRRSDLMRGTFGDDSNPYETMRTYVIAGFFADPESGGNKDLVGWNLIDFDGMAAHEPPFGFYDAELLKGGNKQ